MRKPSAHAADLIFNAGTCAVILGAMAALWGSGCSPPSSDSDASDAEAKSGVATVYVVNYPLKYFAERIGGEYVRVVLPVPADQDPAFWTPGAETIAAYQKADLVLLNGASYAKWTNTVSLPETKILDTSASFSDRHIQLDESITHSHGPEGDHAHAGTASATWLDPQLALAQAQAIHQRLSRLRPRHADHLRRNFTALDEDLKDLDRKLNAAVQGRANQALFFSHPVYQYLQRRGNLNAKSVHWEPDEVPPQKAWDEFTTMLEGHPAKWMIWEAPPTEENVRRLLELGLQSTVFKPCGSAPDGGDFLTCMQQNIENLAGALGE